MEAKPKIEVTAEEMEICLAVLQKYATYPTVLPRPERFNTLVSKVYREGKRVLQQQQKQQKVEADRAVRASTGMVHIQRDALSANLLPPLDAGTRRLQEPDACYVCKQPFTEVHFFYHLLCPTCAEFNYRMRDLHADLTGYTALVTGGRVKIGYQTVLRLLRDGAKVLVTTRFPHSAARRFYAEEDSQEWIHRLHLYGLDLRNIPAVEAFSNHLLQTEPYLDIMIHNAAQTIRRPPGFYQELINVEQAPHATLAIEAIQMVRQDAPRTTAIRDSSALLPSALPGTDILPADRLEDNEERADSRSVNSWLLRLDEVSTPELLEVQLVNSIAPFVLNSRLKSLMTRSPHARRFIVNVSAMEGQFRRHKTVFHPHTNMAKAALNMMTRTSGDDYAKDGIYMTAVDTGWVTDENPTPKRTRIQEDRGFYPPLDIIDGMARIYHPIAEGINSPDEPHYGVFLKDYAPCAW